MTYSTQIVSNVIVGDLGLIPGLGRFSGGGQGNPLQFSCLENPHGQRNLAGYSPQGHKCQTRLNQTKTTATTHVHNRLYWAYRGLGIYI